MVKYNPPHQDLFERSLDQQETPPDLHETQVVEVEVEEKGVKNNNNNLNNNRSNNSHNLTHHQNNNNKSPPPPTNPNSFILHLPSTLPRRPSPRGRGMLSPLESRRTSLQMTSVRGYN